MEKTYKIDLSNVNMDPAQVTLPVAQWTAVLQQLRDSALAGDPDDAAAAVGCINDIREQLPTNLDLPDLDFYYSALAARPRPEAEI